MKLLIGALTKFIFGLTAVILFLHYPLVIVLRIRNEEKVLTEGLVGYREYKQKVKYRLIPFIW